MYEGMPVQLVDEDNDDNLEYDEVEAERHYFEFFEDTHTELQAYGTIVQFKVCKNFQFHLRGNVYVQYTKEEEAERALEVIRGRWYAGKQLIVEYCPVTKWKPAICGLFERNTCPRGIHCNFLHVFKNPSALYTDADRDYEGIPRKRSVSSISNNENMEAIIKPSGLISPNKCLPESPITPDILSPTSIQSMDKMRHQNSTRSHSPSRSRELRKSHHEHEDSYHHHHHHHRHRYSSHRRDRSREHDWKHSTHHRYRQESGHHRRRLDHENDSDRYHDMELDRHNDKQDPPDSSRHHNSSSSHHNRHRRRESKKQRVNEEQGHEQADSMQSACEREPISDKSLIDAKPMSSSMLVGGEVLQN